MPFCYFSVQSVRLFVSVSWKATVKIVAIKGSLLYSNISTGDLQGVVMCLVLLNIFINYLMEECKLSLSTFRQFREGQVSQVLLEI